MAEAGEACMGRGVGVLVLGRSSKGAQHEGWGRVAGAVREHNMRGGAGWPGR